MARFIRLYNSPNPEQPGSVLGFSRGISEAAYDPFLHKRLKNLGYLVTQESTRQKECHIKLPSPPKNLVRLQLGLLGISEIQLSMLATSYVVPTPEYYDAPGIPIPEETVSVTHLLVEPPLKNEDVGVVADCLRSLESVYDAGLRQHYFIDNREAMPKAENAEQGSIIAFWN